MSNHTNNNTEKKHTAFQFSEMTQPLLTSAVCYTDDIVSMLKAACEKFGDFIKHLTSDTIDLEQQLDCNDHFSCISTTLEKVKQEYTELEKEFSDNMTVVQYSRFIGIYNIIVSDYALVCEAYRKLLERIAE
jgi:hypothetical protein